MENKPNYRSGEIRKFFVTKKKETKTKIIFHTRVNGEIRNVVDNKDVDHIPHETLTKALRCALPFALQVLKLVPSNVKIDAGYINRRQILNDANFADYELVGFEYSGDEEDLKCELTVRKSILFGKKIDIKTTPIKIAGKTDFDLSGNLSDAIDDIIEEVYQYHEGKVAGEQTALEIEDSSEEEEETEEEDELDEDDAF